MTVLTMPAPPSQDTALRPVPWRRMIWVTWRQHRPTLISVLAVLGAVAVFLWIAGLWIHHNYAVMTACHPAGSAACQTLSSNFTGTDWTMANTLGIFLQLAPVLIGAFAGAPLLARELETGTYRYAWTQGFGRARWAIAKLVLVAVTITVAAWAFSEVFTWFFQPFLADVEPDRAQRDGVRHAAGSCSPPGRWLPSPSARSPACSSAGSSRPSPSPSASTWDSTAGAWLDLRKFYPVSLVTSNPSLFGQVPLTTVLQRDLPVGTEHLVHRARRQAR